MNRREISIKSRKPKRNSGSEKYDNSMKNLPEDSKADLSR